MVDEVMSARYITSIAQYLGMHIARLVYRTELFRRSEPHERQIQFKYY